MAVNHLVHRCQVRETGGTDFQAVRLVGTIADEVDTELALGMLNRGIDLAFRNFETLGVQLEVMDQGFHVVLHRFAMTA